MNKGGQNAFGARRVVRMVFIGLALLSIGYVLATAVLVIAGLTDSVSQSDVALVLGSKVELNGRPSARLAARLDCAVELYDTGKVPMILVSGGLGKEGYDEAMVMKEYLVSKGIPNERILTDSRGFNTFASARNTAQIAREKKYTIVLVISQYFHIPRCKMALHKCGIKSVYSVHARFFELRDIYSSFRETAGYVSYTFRRAP